MPHPDDPDPPNTVFFIGLGFTLLCVLFTLFDVLYHYELISFNAPATP
jgi:hypothetical protein